LGALVFFYVGYKQFHLAKHVDEFERNRRVSAETAARIRRKPMRLIGCLCIFAGLCFLLLAFIRL